LRNFAEKGDFSTKENGAVFWTGDQMEAAQKWAELNGKTTLEQVTYTMYYINQCHLQTKGGKYLDSLDLFNGPLNGIQAAGIWDIASRRYSENAVGDVYLFSFNQSRISSK
jgi:hypothetical protein